MTKRLTGGDGNSASNDGLRLHTQPFEGICRDRYDSEWSHVTKGELEVRASSSLITVATGTAFIHNITYMNSEEIVIDISLPKRFPRIDCVALRADWSTQIVRVVRISGNEGDNAPETVHDFGKLWEMSLALVTTNPDGTVIVVDQRELFDVDMDARLKAMMAAQMA